MIYGVGEPIDDSNELFNATHESKRDVIELKERLTIVETNVNLLKESCDEILLNQRTNNKDISEIKSMLKQHIRDQESIADSVADINNRIDVQIKPVIEDYSEKIIFLEKLQEFLASKSFKFIVMIIVALIYFIAFRR